MLNRSAPSLLCEELCGKSEEPSAITCLVWDPACITCTCEIWVSDLAGRLLLGKRCERVHSGGSSVSSEEVSELAKSHLL